MPYCVSSSKTSWLTDLGIKWRLQILVSRQHKIVDLPKRQSNNGSKVCCWGYTVVTQLYSTDNLRPSWIKASLRVVGTVVWICTSWSSWAPNCRSTDLSRSNSKNSSVVRPDVGTCGGESIKMMEALTQSDLFAERNYRVVATTFRSSDDMDALSCADPSLNVGRAVGSWNYNICRSRQNG